MSGNSSGANYLSVHLARFRDVHDGPTFSIWRDDTAMKNFAYRPGAHKKTKSAMAASATAREVLGPGRIAGTTTMVHW